MDYKIGWKKNSARSQSRGPDGAVVDLWVHHCRSCIPVSCQALVPGRPPWQIFANQVSSPVTTVTSTPASQAHPLWETAWLRLISQRNQTIQILSKTAFANWTGQLKSQSLDWELDTVNSSPTPTDWKFPIQTNVHVAQVLKLPTTSCNPAPPPTIWDARHGAVRWMPTGSFGDLLRHCGRLQTSPYSPDWRSSMAGNAEEEEDTE